MTVAELRHLIELLPPDAEIKLRVAMDTEEEGEATVEAERVPLNHSFEGWLNCANCGATHRYNLGTW